MTRIRQAIAVTCALVFTIVASPSFAANGTSFLGKAVRTSLRTGLKLMGAGVSSYAKTFRGAVRAAGDGNLLQAIVTVGNGPFQFMYEAQNPHARTNAPRTWNYEKNGRITGRHMLDSKNRIHCQTEARVRVRRGDEERLAKRFETLISGDWSTWYTTGKWKRMSPAEFEKETGIKASREQIHQLLTPLAIPFAFSVVERLDVRRTDKGVEVDGLLAGGGGKGPFKITYNKKTGETVFGFLGNDPAGAASAFPPIVYSKLHRMVEANAVKNLLELMERP